MFVLAAGSRRVVVRGPGQPHGRTDDVAAEEPLEIRVCVAGGHPVAVGVTMRTPGHDEDLAVGFLAGEGVVVRPRDVVSVAHVSADQAKHPENVAQVDLAAGVRFDADRHVRSFDATSACGVCGKASLEHVEATTHWRPPHDGFTLREDVLRRLPDVLRGAQEVFERTGGLHAAGLFDAHGALVAAAEDIGRHNAVDKVVGRRFLAEAFPVSDLALVVSGRAGFEIVQKAVAAGIPLVASVGAPSSLAIDTAEAFGVTLLGFVSSDGFNVYSGVHRIV